jgi:uncharacterized protein YbaP (TraB family)
MDLWLLEEPPARIYIFGAGPSSVPWSSPAIEQLVVESQSFWNEAPGVPPEDMHLLGVYGVKPGAPLAAWLSAAELTRVEAAASMLTIDAQALAPLRPWLAAQIIKLANDARAGFKPEFAPETRLAAVARAHGIAVRSEFGTPEELFKTFASWPREVEIQRLTSTVEEVERGAEWMQRHLEAWRTGRVDEAEALDQEMRRAYPVLYEHLIVGRNRAWVGRIREMVERGITAFIVVGGGHLVGPDSMIAQLQRAGYRPRRVDS